MPEIWDPRLQKLVWEDDEDGVPTPLDKISDEDLDRILATAREKQAKGQGKLTWGQIASIFASVGIGIGVVAMVVLVGIKYLPGRYEPAGVDPMTGEVLSQPKLADDIERVSRGAIDVIEILEAGDFHATIVQWVMEPEPLSLEQYGEIDQLMADAYQTMRVIVATTIFQDGYEVLVVGHSFDCSRNLDPATLDEYPLQCVDGDIPQGVAFPDEALRFLNTKLERNANG